MSAGSAKYRRTQALIFSCVTCSQFKTRTAANKVRLSREISQGTIFSATPGLLYPAWACGVLAIWHTLLTAAD